MGTRQTRLLSPTPAVLAGFTGGLVQLILADGEVLHGVLEAGAALNTIRLRPSQRTPVRAVLLADVRELIADVEANH